MFNIIKLLVGAVRHLFKKCPRCGSKPPRRYDCFICRDGGVPHQYIWDRFHRLLKTLK